MKLLNRATSQQGFIDLHNHTDSGFGWERGHMNLTPLQYLEEVRQYVEKFPDASVSFSITDHNNTDSNLKIIEKIKENPEKYSKINYIPGCEYTVSCDSIGHCYDKDGNPKPIVADNKLHMLAYGMDLEDPTLKYLNTLMDTSKKYVREYITEYKPEKFGNIIFATKAWLKQRNMDIEIGEFKDDCQLQDTFDNTVAVVDKFLRKRFNFNKEEMKDWNDFVNNQDNILKYTKADVQEVMSIVENAGGYCVLAHPLYVGQSQDFQHINDEDNKDPRNDKFRDMPFNDEIYKNLSTNYSKYQKLPEDFKTKNLKSMENYYDYIYRTLSVNAENPITHKKLNGIIGHELMHTANQKNPFRFNIIKNIGDKYGLYCTAGSDSHGHMRENVIPSRVVGPQVYNYDAKTDYLTSAYAITRCDFVNDYIDSQKTGKRLQRQEGRTASNQLELIKTINGKITRYNMNDFTRLLFASYKNAKIKEKSKNRRLQNVRNTIEEIKEF